MKWILVEIEWNGEREMPTIYDRREDAEEDRRYFLSENPRKGCAIREVKEEA